MKTNLIRNRIRSFVGLNERVFFSLPSSVRPSVPPSSELVFFGLSELLPTEASTVLPLAASYLLLSFPLSPFLSSRAPLDSVSLSVTFFPHRSLPGIKHLSLSLAGLRPRRYAVALDEDSTVSS